MAGFLMGGTMTYLSAIAPDKPHVLAHHPLHLSYRTTAHPQSAHQACIEAGNLLLQQQLFEAALLQFEAAQALEVGDRRALIGANHALRKLIPRWHFPMLNDRERNNAFAAALCAVIGATDLVLDIGAGSGLLAMLAARYGAAQVISCEAEHTIAHLADAIINANGMGERIQLVAKRSTELVVGHDLPARADLLVTEIFDCGLLGEGIIPTLRHARQHLLRSDARIIPHTGRIIAALLESEPIHQLNHADCAAGFDVSLFNHVATRDYFPVRLNTWAHRLLTDPQPIFSFDFQHDPLLPQTRTIDFPVSQTGRCHGIVFWFELDLGEQITISNSSANQATHWMQAVQCLPIPLDLEAGQQLELTAAHDDTTVWFTVPSDQWLVHPTITLSPTEKCHVC
jgi:arginine Nomega-methyltransferase